MRLLKMQYEEERENDKNLKYQTAQILENIRKLVKEGKLSTLRCLLPFILKLKGKPYSIKNYFPFEPIFKIKSPRHLLLKTGRQVAKSTSLAAQTIVFSATIPHFVTLYVTPLYEMVRRFSHEYIKKFIDSSPIKNLLVNEKCVNSVLQRSFANGSIVYFSYALLDAERTRGIPADKNVIDEVQDMDFSLLPIIHETLSGSPWAVRQYAGTPKSLDNTIEHLWQESSQGEWCIKCQQPGCGHWNVPSLNWDLLDMIGPVRDDISEERPGTVCSKCRKPLNVRKGHWVHAYPSKINTFPGYHIPQIIMPIHYSKPQKWELLVSKFKGKGNFTLTTFLNEVCGESYDTGTKIITLTELKEACCLPWKNTLEESVPYSYKNGYLHKVLAVDWGGGGGKLKNDDNDTPLYGGGGGGRKTRTSFTTLAVLGILPNGKIDVIWGYRSTRVNDWEWESKLCLNVVKKFGCKFIVHDYTGAGVGREAMIVHNGFPPDNIINVKYHGAASKNIVVFNPPTVSHPRPWYSVDKSRSLITTCLSIKFKIVRFFQFDYVSSEEPGLIYDFLSLMEEKISRKQGTDCYYITSNPSTSDDFAQSVNIGCCMLWYLTNSWPNFTQIEKFGQFTPQESSIFRPLPSIYDLE